jgi:spermidine synthase
MAHISRSARAKHFIRVHSRSFAALSVGVLIGALVQARLTPLCPPGAACIFGAPGVQPYVEYSEVASFWAVYDVQRQVHAVQSAYQHIVVYDTYFHGRILTIDGALMITERDERNYHEMLAHVPLNYLPEAARVLVVGGGDGGTVTQVVRHPRLREVVWVEIDELVVRTSRRYFPKVSAGADDPRVKLTVRNAAHWVAEQQFSATRDGASGDTATGGAEPFDVVLIDSTDFNQAEPLFSAEFYAKLKRLMGARSILCLNADSPQWGQVRLVQFADRLAPLFKHVYVYQSYQPTYSSGHYAFVFASDAIHPTQSAIDWVAWQALGLETRYYTPDVHYAAFMLTAQVRGVLRQPPPRLSDVRVFEQAAALPAIPSATV